jgi:amidohydrolase
MIEEIEEKVESVSKRIRKFRQEIHRNPELSGVEEKTSSFVAGVLEANDIEVTRNVGGFGVVGLLRGGKKGKTIAFRADMDALPLQETGRSDYASCVPGVMHACGHDVHTAILMGAAVVLASMRERLKGNVKFIFQPSEERGSAGAKTMIRDGALKNPKPAMIAALHCFPENEVGEIAHRAGPMTALADRIKIVIKGRGGHASRPHQTVDAVLVASMVINAIHHIVSRRTNPLHQSVISI